MSAGKHAMMITCLLASTAPAGARGRLVLVLNARQGLDVPSVTSIAQDARGFLSIGSVGGLLRYDGQESRIHMRDVPARPAALQACRSARVARARSATRSRFPVVTASSAAQTACSRAPHGCYAGLQRSPACGSWGASCGAIGRWSTTRSGR
jgi:ligand-binding sensor domain-containing protein